jgi:hypothetical protein
VAGEKRKAKTGSNRKRSEAQSRAANRGSAIASYAKEVTKELTSKSDGKVARNRR